MKKRTRWVVIDIETDGLYEPIHVVELSGQLMEGWERIGEPFRMLLNHDIPIPPEAVAIHGYTQEYLRRHGQAPSNVHAAFRDYARNYPLVAHNLSYDWNRCLEPEWARLGIPQIGKRGFCCMMLARRLVPETSSYRLEALKQCFQLAPNQSHRAENDVLTVVELFQRVYRQRLEPAGLDTFDSIVAFAKRTPVAKCLDIVRGCCRSATPSSLPKDEWYYLDADNNAHGPLPARQVSESVGLEAFYIWREGMSDWLVSAECAEFLSLCQCVPVVEPPVRKCEATKTMGELVGLCRGLIADDKITTAEVMFLSSWLQDAGFVAEWPASEIAHTMERILEDGAVTKEEKLELKRLIQTITTSCSPSAVQPSHHAPLASDLVLTTPESAAQYTIIELEQGTREWLEWRHRGIGASDASAIMGENRFKSAAELLREKRGPARDFGQNAAMALGTEFEPEARRLYVAKTGRDVRPACLQSTRYDWLRASLDGLAINHDAVVEIKCGQSAYRIASQTRSVPDYYYGQMQHILAVTGLDSLDFWCYWPGCTPLLIFVPRNTSYIELLLKTELEFWNQVQQSG